MFLSRLKIILKTKVLTKSLRGRTQCLKRWQSVMRVTSLRPLLSNQLFKAILFITTMTCTLIIRTHFTESQMMALFLSAGLTYVLSRLLVIILFYLFGILITFIKYLRLNLLRWLILVLCGRSDSSKGYYRLKYLASFIILIY